MRDRRSIVSLAAQAEAAAMVTLVRVEGSSYRRPGAHLLVCRDGRSAGSISGGCLEAEVVRKAAWTVRGGATLERYSTLFDDTAEIPYGLGCGGVVDLLFEPAGTEEFAALLRAMQESLEGHAQRVTTWLPRAERSLLRAIHDGAGDPRFLSRGGVSQGLGAEMRVTATLEEVTELADETVFVQQLEPPQRLLVLGAGDDAQPLVKMAAFLGWRVLVADGRSQMARPERFPEAEQVVCLRSVSDLQPLHLLASDAAVVMTHSYEQDRALLTALLGCSRSPGCSQVPGYVGLLGAVHRSSLLVGEAAALLGADVAECCARISAPVGMDLGGEGAEAIALAVVAEVQAWRHGRPSAAERLTPQTVERHLSRGGASRYLQCVLDAART